MNLTRTLLPLFTPAAPVLVAAVSQNAPTITVASLAATIVGSLGAVEKSNAIPFA
jgi:triacylglycerol lipase